MKKKITTQIDEETYNKIKKNRWRFNELIMMGIAQIEKKPFFLSSMDELKQKIEILEKSLIILQSKYYDHLMDQHKLKNKTGDD